MNCPSCRQSQPDGSTECSACGVIFAKWKARVQSEYASARTLSQPSSEQTSGPTTEMGWGGVIFGAIVGGVLSVVESSVIAIPFVKSMPKSPEEAVEVMKALMASQSFLMADLGASMLCMAVGGYVAAGSERSSGLKQGAAAGFLLLGFVWAMSIFTPRALPGWYSAASLWLVVPAAIIGGILR